MLGLTREKALIFRICHIDNVPWLLANGVHCRSSAVFDPNYRNIGNLDLIAKRAAKDVPIPPGGSFNDYVPFYFTSRSPMLYNIKTGWNVDAVPMRDIAILVSSLHRVAAAGINFVYTDRHAYMATARFSSSLNHLDRIDWKILDESDFKSTSGYPDKKERYQAEALIHRRLPTEALAGIICYDESQSAKVARLVESAGSTMKVIASPKYFF